MQGISIFAQYAAAATLAALVGVGCLPKQGDAGTNLGKSWLTNKPTTNFKAPDKWDNSLPLSDQSNKGNWELVPELSDEFSGTTVDTSKWELSNPKWAGRPPGWRNPANATIKDGILTLTTKKEDGPTDAKTGAQRTYSCGMIRSIATQKYGYFEAKAKPAAASINSAFWLYHQTPDDWTEIDVFEIGGNSPKWKQVLHTNAHVFTTPTSKEHLIYPGVVQTGEDLYTSYHVYGLEWTPSELKYYVDGQLVREGKNDHWNTALNVIASTGISANWFGSPTDSDLPADFDVDYIRTWKTKS